MGKPHTLQFALPKKLSTRLFENIGLSGDINSILSDFAPWFADNKTPFFPEYTDHGIAHINNVLESVSSLIPEIAWEMATPEDVGAIVAVVLLHDCAMHLSEAGLTTLLSEDNHVVVSSYIKDCAWREEFERFQQEASRWDEQKIFQVFGDHDPPELIEIGKPLTPRQFMLAGEFLRRHHARLAHEIAIAGVPGQGDRFAPFARFDLQARDLYGFIARSHNLGIREAVDLIPRIRRRVLSEVHVPYVMALLRIADYIQIDSARAPKQILQTRSLKSPISQREWAKHHAVLDLHQYGDDPEALNVIADPQSAEVFCGLRLLFNDLQRELDETWAVLGEVYGRVDDLKALGLSVRRLVSNLDSVEQFELSNSPTYVPKDIRLTTSSAELLQLLVGPLYGNQPTIGVRELLQNSVDAILERERFCKVHNEPVSFSTAVEIELDFDNPKSRFVRVSDCGVGMTLETIENFFLKAGASFRRSQWWKSEFTDTQGKSDVRRSGRFGVGALAAFLLGPSFTVVTRHFLDTTGIGLKMTVSLDERIIEISRVQADIGTTISVRVAEDRVVEELLNSGGRDAPYFGWYIYSKPEVNFRVHREGKWVQKKRPHVVAEKLIASDSTWVEVFHPEFDGIYWSYEDRRSIDAYSKQAYLACNGIFVTSGFYGRETPNISIADKGSPAQIAMPCLLVDDKNGRFPLNIQRNGIVDKRFPFQRELAASIADVFARELYLSLNMAPVPSNIPEALRQADRVFSKFSKYRRAQILGLSSCGWIPLDAAVMSGKLPSVVIFDVSQGEYDGYLCGLEFSENSALLIPFLLDGQGYGAVVAAFRVILEGSNQWNYSSPIERFQKFVLGMRVFVRQDIDNAFRKRGGLPQYLLRGMVLRSTIDGWFVYEVGSPGDVSDEDISNAVGEMEITKSRCVVFCYFDPAVNAELIETAEPFAPAWLETVPNGYLAREPTA